MLQGIFGEPQACKNLAKFLETIFKNWINEHMQPREPLKACGEANECIIFQKMKKNLDYNSSRKVSASHCETSVKSICD